MYLSKRNFQHFNIILKMKNSQSKLQRLMQYHSNLWNYAFIIILYKALLFWFISQYLQYYLSCSKSMLNIVKNWICLLKFNDFKILENYISMVWWGKMQGNPRFPIKNIIYRPRKVIKERRSKQSKLSIALINRLQQRNWIKLGKTVALFF